MRKVLFYVLIFVGGIFIAYLMDDNDAKSTTEKDTEKVKTEFASCDELKQYLGWSDAGQHAYEGFTDLKEKWEGRKIKISDPFCNSELCYVNVLFEGVKVNGSDVWLIFEADTKGHPFSWCTGFDCDKISDRVPTIEYN
jgi:hypothetical protein